MKYRQTLTSGPGIRRPAAFTLTELLFAVGIGSVVLAMAATFITMALRSTSGIVQQSVINGQAGRSSEIIFERIRFATSVAAIDNGNTLRLGFDDNFAVDSNNDKKKYNDKDHYEIIQFINGDGDDATTADNQLIYKARDNVASTNILVARAVGKMPGKSVFAVTNGATVLLNYVLVDDYAADGHQSCAVQAAFVTRNRPDEATVISILP